MSWESHTSCGSLGSIQAQAVCFTKNMPEGNLLFMGGLYSMGCCQANSDIFQNNKFVGLIRSQGSIDMLGYLLFQHITLC